MDARHKSSSESIKISIECQTDPGIFHFDVSPETRIKQFLVQVLERLAEGSNAERVRNMREYYEPILELVSGSTTIPLDSAMTLSQAGAEHGSVCRISARPLKERIMFCNNG